MTAISVYLTFNGNCEEAFNFYKSVFGGNFQVMSRFKEMPVQEGKSLSPEEGEKIMHVSLAVSKETYLMGSDTGGEWSKNYTQGNNFALSINAGNKEEADKIFNELSAGGHVTMPMAVTFWGSYFGMFTDKFGINWMMSVENNDKKSS
jgi:PhnB protein